jgi:CDP-diglyceride synthetase
MTPSLLTALSGLFIGLFVAGSIACLPLYHWKLRDFLVSRLWVKIAWWLPIYGIFLLLCYGTIWVALPLVIALITQAIREYRRYTPHQIVVKFYLGFFIIATTFIVVLTTTIPIEIMIRLLIVICFCSVLSDVCAFFLGTYASWHKLPAWINERKAWEGVAGQIIGAFVGAGLLWLFVGVHAPWWLILAIGLASAFGDLFNSVAKRQLGVKDWAHTIPGHGGILDRMSSLSTAFMVVSLIALFTPALIVA